MLEIQGYYNGVVCIPLESGKLRKNQKILITALDEEIVPPIRKLGTLEGKATVSFAKDWNMSSDEFNEAAVAYSKQKPFTKKP